MRFIRDLFFVAIRSETYVFSCGDAFGAFVEIAPLSNRRKSQKGAMNQPTNTVHIKANDDRENIPGVARQFRPKSRNETKKKLI